MTTIDLTFHTHTRMVQREIFFFYFNSPVVDSNYRITWQNFSFLVLFCFFSCLDICLLSSSFVVVVIRCYSLLFVIRYSLLLSPKYQVYIKWIYLAFFFFFFGSLLIHFICELSLSSIFLIIIIFLFSEQKKKQKTA